VRAHDFPEQGAHKAVPYGIYDLAADAGWVSVGWDGDTAAFAVATLRRLWNGAGRHHYPARDPAADLCRRGWRERLPGAGLDPGTGRLRHASGLQVTVCHFPPGPSVWNKIEHRLFSWISSNWRGRPLTSHEVVVGTIGATTTRTGRTVHSELDPGAYPTGVTIPDQVMVALPLTAHDWHGRWNDTLGPEPPLPVPGYEDRTQPADRAPDWLDHPALTGMDSRAFADLLAAVEQDLLDHPPISLHHQRARHHILGRGPLSLSDRLLVPVLRHRWKTQIRALTTLLGSPANAVGDALHEMTPILETLDRRIRQAPITAPTTADLANLIGRTHTKKGK
jgi:hypothetical protein